MELKWKEKLQDIKQHTYLNSFRSIVGKYKLGSN